MVHRASLHSPAVGRQLRRVKEPLTLGGLACLARATAVGHSSSKARLAAFSSGARKALQSLPESARRLVAGAFAGKVRGRLAAAAWAGEK